MILLSSYSRVSMRTNVVQCEVLIDKEPHNLIMDINSYVALVKFNTIISGDLAKAKQIIAPEKVDNYFYDEDFVSVVKTFEKFPEPFNMLAAYILLASGHPYFKENKITMDSAFRFLNILSKDYSLDAIRTVDKSLKPSINISVMALRVSEKTYEDECRVETFDVFKPVQVVRVSEPISSSAESNVVEETNTSEQSEEQKASTSNVVAFAKMDKAETVESTTEEEDEEDSESEYPEFDWDAFNAKMDAEEAERAKAKEAQSQAVVTNAAEPEVNEALAALLADE